MSSSKPIPCAVEQRCVIKFLAKEKVKPIEIYKRLLIQFGESCLAKSNVYTWVERFKNGRDSVIDDARNHMQPNAVTPQNILRAETLIKSNPGISVRDLASELAISVGSIQNIIRKKLKLSKLDDKWVQLEMKEGEEEETTKHQEKRSKGMDNCDFDGSKKRRKRKSLKFKTSTTTDIQSCSCQFHPEDDDDDPTTTTMANTEEEEEEEEPIIAQERDSHIIQNNN